MEPCSPVFTIDGRSRFPRPDFIREHWESLDGVWAFSFDRPVFDREITVPFCYQSEKSGIGETDDHEEVWYRRTFSVSQKDLTGRLLLHFGAVDYQARVWVNDRPAGEHTGGHAPFALDITELVQDGENCLTVQAIDRTDPAQPRLLVYPHHRHLAERVAGIRGRKPHSPDKADPGPEKPHRPL